MFITVAHTKFCKSPLVLISYEGQSFYPPHNGFIAIMFSAHVSGSWSTFKMASHTPFMGSIQAENGIRSTYSQAIKNATGQARNHRIRNHRIAHRMPGHRPPPFPLPSPCPIKAGCQLEAVWWSGKGKNHEACFLNFLLYYSHSIAWLFQWPWFYTLLDLWVQLLVRRVLYKIYDS